ncbi:MAG: Fe-S cluster assembly protein IscX [Phycisphaerales bacterium]|nr:Fe-S cluster assembly protein IscX [Phycisphaerales bacterium]
MGLGKRLERAVVAGKTFGWLDVQRISEELAAAYPGMQPYTVRFIELRKLVESLPGFEEEAGHPVNEKILETIQSHWAGEVEEDD